MLQADQYGGGKNLIVGCKHLVTDLSKKSLAILQNNPMIIRVPQEFYKGISYLSVPLIDQALNVRYRRELILLEDLTREQKNALHELEQLAYSDKHLKKLIF